MAPSYDNLPSDDEFDEEEIDFSDLREQYEVRLEESFDTFVVVDGLPVVTDEQKPKLTKFLLRKLNDVGNVRDGEEGVRMPVNQESGMTEGYAFVEFSSSREAIEAVKQLHGKPLDKKHTLSVNKLVDIERYGREGKINEEYVAPPKEDFQEKEYLRWWIKDSEARDQFAMYRGDNVAVCWNEKDLEPETVVDRQHWTEMFIQWSPLGTYLSSMHAQGVQLWGGHSWGRQKRFMHPGVNLVDFSPNENYVVTWSHRPINVEENNPILSAEEDGKNYIIWDVATGKPLRSFVTLDLPGPQQDEQGNPVKKKIQWPAFKWSSDDKYVARMTFGQSISVYELPRMNLLDKTSIKIEGVQDFEWAPAAPHRAEIREYEQLLCFWTPEIGSSPARVGLMTMPSKEIVRTRNLFNVSDAKLHWQSDAKYVCVKVDRHSKSKKSLATNLEIFRVQEKGVPVEVVDCIKDTVINFAWEPKGDRFVLITAGEIPANVAVPPKTSVSFFCPEKQKGPAAGNFKLIRTIDKKNSNAIYWSPKGRFVVVGTIHSQQSFELDFWDLDYEGDKEEKDKDLTANLALMATAEHYGITDCEWDPTGRYVATVASAWKHQAENGYHLYDFRGTTLREVPTERFKQLTWRPRPPTLLTKDEQKQVRKNLREYSKQFDEQDAEKRNAGDRAVIEGRKNRLEQWLQWRDEEIQRIVDEYGSVEEPIPGQKDKDDGGEVVEEIVEEIIDEKEEIIS